ncbi:MAG: hypothetical protein OEV73_00500 [Desulfobulbaceae bacterium]|nr:hypothetical protein [Desulfobulbaceae bacterium]
MAVTRMSLDGYTFARNPPAAGVGDIATKGKAAAVVQTYSSADVFEWPATIVGKTVTLSWPFIPAGQHTTLAGKFEAPGSKVWNPQDGTGKSYNVAIIDYPGTSCKQYNAEFMKDVTLTLFILSQV